MMLILNGMLNHTKPILSGVVRKFGTTLKVSASHYDVLGVTPKATQADIKSAYYKLSKLYHPDKSGDEESAKKFRDISEAYEVLGNIKLKKMYDKGLLVGRENNSTRMGGEYRAESEPTDPTLRFYKSRGQRNVAPTMDGRTPIYDFDEWQKNHYGDLLKKAKYDKEYIKHCRDKQMDYKNSVNQEIIIYITAFICVCFVGLVTYGKNDYDKDSTSTSRNMRTEPTKETDSNKI